jgi:hypothetical protein
VPTPSEMPVPRRLIDFEFSPAALVQRIVRGALERDMVRMHGGIVAAFEIYGAQTAEQDVFASARRLAAACSPDCHAMVAEAIGRHARASPAGSPATPFAARGRARSSVSSDPRKVST